MCTLLIAAGAVAATTVCCGIKALVWWAGARPGRMLPRDRAGTEWTWVW
jgi:hypothetical protein